MSDEFDDLYDERTLAALDRAAGGSAHEPETVHGWRRGIGVGALAGAALMGVGDVLEPARRDPVVEEIDLLASADPRAPVVYHHVPGAPRLSRAIVRPWLFAD